MASTEPLPMDRLSARSGSAAGTAPAGTSAARERPGAAEPVRAAARGGAGWVARADAGRGFIALARGTGRANWLADEFLAAVAGALEEQGPAGAVPQAAGPPPVVHAILSLLKAAHRELLKDGVPEQGLETLVAIADGNRVHLIAAGGVACLRRRGEEIELLAPVNQRPRPPLGGSPRALIEVTSETLRSGDLLVAIPGGYELATHAGLAAEAREMVAICAAWARSAGALDVDPASLAPCAAMTVPGAEGVASLPATTGALAGGDPVPGGSPLAGGDLLAPAADPHARVEIRNDTPAAAPASDVRPADAIELPSWLTSPATPASESAAEIGAPESDGPAHRRRATRPAFLSARNAGLVLAMIGVVVLLLAGMRVVLDRHEGTAEQPPDSRAVQVRAAAAPAAGGIGGLAALDGERAPSVGSGAPPAPTHGALSALTEPFIAGVEVFVDERPVGPAPAVLDRVAPGRHRVRFSGPQGFGWEEEILVRPGETSQAVARAGDVEDVTLVTVQTTAMSERGVVERSGWTVLVDGIEEGETPLDVELDPGVHAITIRRASGPPIHRVLDIRRGDRLILDVNLDELPAISLEHTPPAHWKAGDSPVLTVVRSGRDARSAEPVHLHVAADDRWQHLAMAPIPGAPGTHAVGVPLPETSGKTLRYYFSTRSDAGEEVFSAIYSARLR